MLHALTAKLLPKFVRKLIGNFVNNLALPLSAVNSFLQDKVDNGLATISNFLINSTIGVLGIFDVAKIKEFLQSKKILGKLLDITILVLELINACHFIKHSS